MIDLAINGYFLKSRDKLIELKGKKGLTGIEIIKEIYYQIIKNENINENIKVKLIDKIATIEFRIIEGSSEEIQIESLLATISLVLKKIK